MSAKTMTHAISPLIEARYLALNDESEMDISFETVAGTKVLIIENVYRDPEYVRSLALSLNYHRPAGMYPGYFAFVSISTRPLPMKFNRLVVYDSNLFHTPHFHEDCFGETLETRRLTQNLYFNLRKDSMGKPDTLTS